MTFWDRTRGVEEHGNVLREAWRAILDMLIKARVVVEGTGVS